MRSLVVAILMVCGVASAQPAAPLPPVSDRLVALAKVWAKVEVFHPYLAYKDLDWDAALVAAIPKVEAAKTTQEYRAALNQMLHKLGDPLTRMIDAPPVPVARTLPEAVTTPAPGIMVLDVAALVAKAHGMMQVWNAAQGVVKQASAAKVIVIDLRTVPEPGTATYVVDDLLADALPAVDAWPQQRVIEHHGFRTQEGTTSGGYQSAFTMVGAGPAHARTTGPAHAVFIADPIEGVPPVAQALQAAGRATIIAAGPIDEDTVTLTDDVEVPGAGVAHVRMGELMWGPPKPDVIDAKADLVKRAIAVARDKVSARPVPHAPKLAQLPAMKLHDANDYAATPLPSRELRMLAGIRAWATLEYFWPYRSLAGDWDAVLRDMLPRLAAASTAEAYLHVLQELGARGNDGHIGVYAKNETGPAWLGPPFTTRLVEQKLVVSRIFAPEEAKKAGVLLGDVIETIDGKPAAAVMQELRPRVSGSTDEARDQGVARRVLVGPEPTIKLAVRGADGKLREVVVTRSASFPPLAPPHWKKLANNIGFVDLNLLTPDEIDPMFAELGTTTAIVFDMRGYPKGVAWSLAPRVNTKHAKVAAQFFQPLVTLGQHDKTIHFDQELSALPANEKLYTGKIVVLIDWRAISQAEHTCMFLEAAAGATFVGSPTAGANGDVTVMRLPGGLRMSFTGQEPRHADGARLQRIGIQPHILIRPTLAGIRAGKDEVLDRALAFLATGK